VEAALVNAAGHQEVSCAFGGGLDEHGGFNLNEAVLVEVVPGDLGDLVAHQDVFLQVGTAQVQIAVLQAQVLFHAGVFHDLKGRGFGFAQNPQFLHIDFHLAGGDFHVPGVPLPDNAPGCQHILGTGGKGLVENSPVGAVVKGQLNHAAAVPQIDEDQLSQIALTLYPAEDNGFLSDIGGAKLSAVMGSLEPGNGFCHDKSLLN